jgi:chromosome segregation ATPase
MTKRYLGKNINIFLLVIIIISVLSFMGMASYYNKRHESISNDYGNITKEIRMKTNELIATKNELTELKSTLNQTSVDVEKYGELYTEKVSQLEDYRKKIDIETAENSKLKGELLKATNDLALEQKKNNELSIQLKEANDDLSDCKKDLRGCRDSLEDCDD